MKTTIMNATINPMTNTCYVTYSTGTEKMYPADKLPKTVSAWLAANPTEPDPAEEIEEKTEETVEAVTETAEKETQKTAEAVQEATRPVEQLPATCKTEPEVKIKKPTRLDEMVREAARAEVEAMQATAPQETATEEVVKKPEQAAEAETPQQTHEEPRTAVNWKEVIKATGRVIKRETGRLCEAGKKLTAAVAPKAKLAGAATAMLLMDLLAILIPIICDVAVAIAGCAWGFATDILPEWARYTATPAAARVGKAVARESAKVYKAVVTKAVKDYHDAVSDLTRAYRAVVTAAAIMAYMMRIVLA